ncbi:MAG: cytochrome-c peroxidase [Chitinophagales bacterium]|nr:cytochrome-c peroxidase [Chitinophagales bacterium]
MLRKITYLLLTAGLLYSCQIEDNPIGDGLVIPSIYDPSEYPLPAPFFFPQAQVGLEDNPVTNAGFDLGRHLFYEKRLSIDNSISCGGCHKQEFAFSDGGEAFSVKVDGSLTARNTPSLANLGYMTDIFWDGRQKTPRDAAADAAMDEQHIIWDASLDLLANDTLYRRLFSKAFVDGAITKENTISAIEQFMRALISDNSDFDKFLRGEYTMTPSEFNGFELFRSEVGDCFHCHFSSALLTDNIFHNNGLDSVENVLDFEDYGLGDFTGDLNDYGLFKTPTIRNLSFTPPYMHDGRFQTVDEVIDFYAEGLQSSPTIDPLMKNLGNNGNQLTNPQKADLKAFILTLDDHDFVNNPAFSDPF